MKIGKYRTSRRTGIIMFIILCIIIAIIALIMNKEESNNKNDETTQVSKMQEENEAGNEIKIQEGNVGENNKRENATYYIKVNCQENVVTIYEPDKNGKYTVPIRAMLCSVGDATPKTGVYKTSKKYRWQALFGNVYGQYCTRITGHILFHSVPYLEKGNSGSLEYWEYDKLGESASAGCVRLTVEDALWIYENCKEGTQVEFYSDSTPGPLGKPEVQKISDKPEEIRSWDPTDPVSANPWKNYEEK